MPPNRPGHIFCQRAPRADETASPEPDRKTHVSEIGGSGRTHGEVTVRLANAPGCR